MGTVFATEFFMDNRRRLRDKLATGLPVVLTANGLLQRNGDSTYKFRQDSNFWYLTGIEEADVTLVMAGGEEYLIVPGRDMVRQAFDGAVDIDGLMGRSGVGLVLDEDEGWARLSRAAKQSGTVAVAMPPEAYIGHAGMYSNPARRRLMERLCREAGEITLTDVRELLAGMRAVKQPLEIAALQTAIDITIGGLQAAASPDALAGYQYEYQAEAELSRYFKLHGASGHAFEPIIVAGKRACTLHNLSMDGAVASGQLLQFDVGAEYGMYAADISRAYAVGEPTARQRQVHQAVCDVQDYALGLLKPGVLLADYEEQVASFMGQQLQALGLAQAPDGQTVRRYYPHAASHFLGLDVHDAGLYKQPLAAGMVVTCEPGIYIPEEAIGIRIEDDVLITDDGCQVLSGQLSRALC